MKQNCSKSNMANQCQECGCHCDSCVNNNSIHLHQEIEDLKQKLKEREQQILTMESQILGHANKFPSGEMQALRDNLYHWQDKHERLLENYRKLQKVNQSLEDKLLRVADRFENEKIAISQSMANLTNELNETRAALIETKQTSETYRKDYDSIVKFVQSQSLSGVDIYSLPEEVQVRARQYLEREHLKSRRENGECDREKSIGFPLILPTFPPTAVLYSDWPERKKINDTNNGKDTDSSNGRMLTSSMFYQIFKIQNTDDDEAKHTREETGKSNNLCNNCNRKIMNTNDDHENDGRHKTIVI